MAKNTKKADSSSIVAGTIKPEYVANIEVTSDDGAGDDQTVAAECEIVETAEDIAEREHEAVDAPQIVEKKKRVARAPLTAEQVTAYSDALKTLNDAAALVERKSADVDVQRAVMREVIDDLNTAKAMYNAAAAAVAQHARAVRAPRRAAK